MKTNKEIKPFKMRCENKEDRDVIIAILINNGFRSAHSYLDTELALVLHEDGEYQLLNSDSFTSYNCYGSQSNDSVLTYSEFIKLYGGEEEVFTREDMKEFAWGCTLFGVVTFGDIEQQFTNFLSERTND